MSLTPSSNHNVVLLNPKNKLVGDLPKQLVAPAGVRNPFKAKHFIASLGFAVEGLRYITHAERNFRIHLGLAVFAMGLGALHHVSFHEWIALCIVCGLVLFAEAANTAIELLVDMITHGEFDARAKAVKDVAAGACLMCAVVAAVVGCLIFIPRWIAFFS